MLKSITKASYEEEKNILKYTLGIEFLNENNISDIKNIDEIFEFTYLKCFDYLNLNNIDLKMPEKISNGYFSCLNQKSFKFIFKNHSIISSLYTIKKEQSGDKTASLNSVALSADIDAPNFHGYVKSILGKDNYLSNLLSTLYPNWKEKSKIPLEYKLLFTDVIHYHKQYKEEYLSKDKFSKFDKSLLTFYNLCYNRIFADKKEQILYKYENERFFSVDYLSYIKKAYLHYSDKKDFMADGTFFYELCFLGSMLPNVFTRKAVMENIFSNYNSEDLVGDELLNNSYSWLKESRKFLLNLIFIAFPIIEKAFTINLSEYCRIKEKNVYEILSEYFDENYNMLIYNLSSNGKAIPKIELSQENIENDKYSGIVLRNEEGNACCIIDFLKASDIFKTENSKMTAEPL